MRAPITHTAASIFLDDLGLSFLMEKRPLVSLTRALATCSEVAQFPSCVNERAWISARHISAASANW